jgi:hypothetical protein
VPDQVSFCLANVVVSSVAALHRMSSASGQISNDQCRVPSPARTQKYVTWLVLTHSRDICSFR